MAFHTVSEAGKSVLDFSRMLFPAGDSRTKLSDEGAKIVRARGDRLAQRREASHEAVHFHNMEG